MRNKVQRYAISLLILTALVLFCLMQVQAAESSLSGLTFSDASISGTTVTMSASREKWSSSSTTKTVTITNDNSYTVQLAFSYEAKTAGGTGDTGSATRNAPVNGTVEIDEGNKCVMTLKAGGSFTIEIVADDDYGFAGSSTYYYIMSDVVVTRIYESANLTVNYNSECGAVSYNDMSVTANSTIADVAEDETLIATPAPGMQFIAWTDKNGKILTKSTTYTVAPTDANMTIQAIFTSTTPWFYVDDGNYLVEGWTEAMKHTGTVVLANNATLPAGTYEVPSDVTLLIPYDSALTCTVETPEVAIPAAPSTPTAYRTLTMADGAHVTVNGIMTVPAKVFSANTNTKLCATMVCGQYGHVDMQSGSSITVASGAKLSAFGYITGSGEVKANSGAKVYEAFQVARFRGGSATSSMATDKDTFPISQYYVQNIEVPLTIYAGAQEIAYVALYMSDTVIDSSVAYIGQSDCLFNLTSGYLIKQYDKNNDRQQIDVHGDITVSKVTVNIKYIISYSIDSSDFVMPITNNMTIDIHDGATVNLGANMSMLPGSEINIHKGGTVILSSGKSLYLYDLDEWSGKGYVYGDLDMAALVFVPDRIKTRTADDLKDAQIVVEGTLDASAGNLYTSAGHAAIKGKAGGQVLLTYADETTDKQAQQSGTDITYCDVAMYSAYLQNADDSHFQANTNTFTYDGTNWSCATHTGEADHTCDVCKITTECSDSEGDGNHACDICGEGNISTCVDAGKDHTCDECDGSVGEHTDANTDHICDYGCSEKIGTCEDADKDHDCDHGCDKYFGTHTDTNKDHVCDYGCSETIGTCADGNLDHKCDYGCSKGYGEHKDTNNDHICEYEGCTAGAIGTHEDTNKDHKCDYGCSVSIGDHDDTNNDHVCEYGCAVSIGTCEDADKDHDCDYGCDKVYGTCEDADNDHDCDYGCTTSYGEHVDIDTNHACDYGCSEAIGTCEDADKDHDCDYGCTKVYGEHTDADTDHACDYGCTVSIGTCEDADKDHDCDYGCTATFGTCEDADKDHDCDYGCTKVYGEHTDADTDHACDYGCTVAFGTCEDADKDHDCDYGCTVTFGTCEDADKDHDCDYGCDKVYGEHTDANADHACDYGCSETIGECSDSETDTDHVCDYGCGKKINNCSDQEDDGDHKCDTCDADNVTPCVDKEEPYNYCDECNKEGVCDHQWTSATCTAPKTCSTCGATNGDALGHTDADNDGDHICDRDDCTETCTFCSDVAEDGNHTCDECLSQEKLGECADVNNDHQCDECSADMSTCVDQDRNHECDYAGCTAQMGEHEDTNHDHTCDYGCTKSIGTCEDTDFDHACDYGCDQGFGTCEDIDHDHACDYGCDKDYGTHDDTDKNHVCDYGCSESIGTCEDTDFDHACDYGCSKVYGAHEDADKDHDCDYGCSVSIGTHNDNNMDHDCDYGCEVSIGTHTDVNTDHQCDYGCSETIGTHADTDTDHACDYGCKSAIGTCEDKNKDHVCDYGCTVAFGTCEDADKDHSCDYGCGKTFGTHADNDFPKDHVCDYGCSETIGTCVDADRDHYCDYGCDKIFGDHLDANENHVCDYGCAVSIGTCEDADLDHKCDYGCGKDFGTHEDTDFNHACDYGCSVAIGTHVDTNKDHACDYGCAVSIGTCEDADKDHDCDYGCNEVYGEHADIDKNHVCDYGCAVSIGTCEDADKDHDCDYGCSKVYGNHVDSDSNHACDYGCSVSIGACEDVSPKDHACDHGCGQEFGDHQDNDKNHVCDYGCAVAIGEHVDSEDDKDHLCDYGCGVAMNSCVDNDPADNVCDVCGKENVCQHDYVPKDTPPTCTAKGYTTHTCSDCGDSYTDSYVDVIDHVGGEAIEENRVEATCTSTGSYNSVIYCSGCGTKLSSEYVTIQRLDHEYASVVTQPTCTEKGFTTYTCDCSAYYISDEVTATGHSYDAVVTAPTCTAQGYTTHTCSVCTDSYVDSYVDATGDHVYSEERHYNRKESWKQCTECDEKYDVVARTYNVTIVDCWGNVSIRKGYTYGQYLWLNYSTSNVLELQYNGWKLQSEDGEKTVQAYEVWESFVIDDATTELIVYEDSTVQGVKYGAIMMSVSYDQANSEKTMTVDLFIYVDSLADEHKPVVKLGETQLTLEKIDDSIMMYFVSIPLSAEQITQGGTNVQITVSYKDVPVKTIDSVLIAYEEALDTYLKENVGDYAGEAQDEAINAVLNYGKAVQLVFGNPEGISFEGYTEDEIAKYAANVSVNDADNTVNGVTFKWKSASVNFQSEYSIRYKFTLDGADGYTPISAQLIVKDNNGNVLHNYEQLDVVLDDGKYSVMYPVPASDLTKAGTTVQLKITMTDSNEQTKIAESSELNYGIYAYMVRELYRCTENGGKYYLDDAKTDEYVNMLVSLIKLGEAVNRIDEMTSN